MTLVISLTHHGDDLSEIALSIDTSAGSGSLTLFKLTEAGHSMLNTITWHRVHSHSENLILEGLEILNKSHLSLKDIDHIIVTHGPGSFTGIRVGLNFAKTLAYGLDKPIYTIDTLTAIAYGKKNSPHPLVVINNAHKNMVYIATYSTQPFSTLLAPMALHYSELDQVLKEDSYICLGDGYTSYQSVLPEKILNKLNYSEESVSNISQTLGEFWCENRKKISAFTWNDAIPLYIRSSEAEERLWKGLKSK